MQVVVRSINRQYQRSSESKKYIQCTVTAPLDGEHCKLALALTLDLSSSMKGQRLELAKIALKASLDQLNETDYFCIIGYNRGAFVIHPLSVATATNKQVAKLTLDIQETRVGTNIHAGWKTAIQSLLSIEGDNYFKQCLLFTDGCAGIGPRKIDGFQDGCHEATSQLIYTSTVGLGEYCNHVFLRDLADQCGGKSFYVRSEDVLEEVFLRELRDNRDVLLPKVTLICKTSGAVTMLNLGPQPHFMVRDKLHVELFAQRQGQLNELLLLATINGRTEEQQFIEITPVNHLFQPVGEAATILFSEEPVENDKEVAEYASRFLLALGAVRLYEYRDSQTKQQQVLKKLEEMLELLGDHDLWELEFAALCGRYRRAIPDRERLEFFDDCSAVLRSTDMTGVTSRVTRNDKYS